MTKLQDLVVEFAVSVEVLDEPDPGEIDVILNTTSASLSGSALSLDWGRAKEGSSGIRHDVWGRVDAIFERGGEDGTAGRRREADFSGTRGPFF